MKPLCKWGKKKIQAHFDEVAEIISNPKFICKKCGRIAGNKKYLCKGTSL